MADSGLVVAWFQDLGWGVIESPRTPGGCWFHYADVLAAFDPIERAPGGAQVLPFVALTVGEAVEFAFEAPGQDGYDFKALWVRAGPAQSVDPR